MALRRHAGHSKGPTSFVGVVGRTKGIVYNHIHTKISWSYLWPPPKNHDIVVVVSSWLEDAIVGVSRVATKETRYISR
jgi:hypothetical protein